MPAVNQGSYPPRLNLADRVPLCGHSTFSNGAMISAISLGNIPSKPVWTYNDCGITRRKVAFIRGEYDLHHVP